MEEIQKKRCFIGWTIFLWGVGAILTGIGTYLVVTTETSDSKAITGIVVMAIGLTCITAAFIVDIVWCSLKCCCK